MKKSCFLVSSLLLTLVSITVHADPADWLQVYYDKRGICVSNASVKEISTNSSTLFVHLDVEEKYIGRLLNGGPQIVQDWLALHCPLPMVAYSKNIGDQDVVIMGSKDLTLSCRYFENNR